MPLDINRNDSWKGSSSDSDTNDASVKSKHIASDLFIHNSTSNPTDVSYKLAHKRKKLKRHEPKVMISTGILSKKTKVTSMKDKTYFKKAQVRSLYWNKQLNLFLMIFINKQGQKRQANKIKKRNMLKDKFKSSRICNGQISHINSNAVDNLKDVSYENDISCNNNYECLHQNVLKIDKTIISQNESVRTNDSNFKHIANYQLIKPCFVKLNACTVQNYMNLEKIAENKHDTLHNAKVLYTNTFQTKNISKIQNTISHSISTEYDTFGDFKHVSVKQCSVALCDNIVKDWNILKNKREKNMKNTIDIKNKPNISHLVFHNLSEITPNCNKNIEFAPYDTKKNRDIVKDSFVKVERLKIGKFVKENSTVSNEEEQNIVSSTPLGKRVKSSCLVIFSPINSNIYDKLHWSQEYSLITAKEDISNIDRKDSNFLITMPKYYKFNSKAIQEHQTQDLLSQKSQISTDSIVKNKVKSCKDDIHVAVTQKYNTECNVETEIPYSLSMSTVNQSRSLFDDTTYSHDHLAKDINKDNMKKEYSFDALAYKFIKMDTVDSSVDLCLKQKQLSDNKQVDASISPKISVTFRDSKNTMHTEQKYEFQNYDTRINTVEAVYENLEDKTVNTSKHTSLDENQDNINIDARVLLTRLQDPIRIGRRMQYPKWHLSMSNISISEINNETTQSNNEIFHNNATTDKDFFNAQLAYNSEHSKNVLNMSRDHFESFNSNTIQLYNDIGEMEKPVFLKSGKYWARSLSILNNINDESNLDKLSIGKGKKWRCSVRDILDMQKQGNFLY